MNDAKGFFVAAMWKMSRGYLWKYSSMLNNEHHNGGPYHIETISFICSANQWTGFFMVGTSVMKVLIKSLWKYLPYQNIFLTKR